MTVGLSLRVGERFEGSGQGNQVTEVSPPPGTLDSIVNLSSARTALRLAIGDGPRLALSREIAGPLTQEALDTPRPFDTRSPTTRSRRVPSWAAEGLSG